MPAVVGDRGVIMDNCSMDNRSLAPSVQSNYTVLKNPVEMNKSNTTVHDILKYNLLNSRRKTKLLYRQSFDESFNKSSVLTQRSRIDTISKSFGTLRGLPKRQVKASIDNSNLSMNVTVRKITDLNVSKLSQSQKLPFDEDANNALPTQQISTSTLNPKTSDTVRRKSIIELFNEIDTVFKEHSSDPEINNTPNEVQVVPTKSNANKNNAITAQTASSTITGTQHKTPTDNDITTTGLTINNESEEQNVAKSKVSVQNKI